MILYIDLIQCIFLSDGSNFNVFLNDANNITVFIASNSLSSPSLLRLKTLFV